MSERTRTIPLTRGYVAIVDAADYAELSKYRWKSAISRRKHGILVYAARSTRHPDGRPTSISMHRQIMQAKSGQLVDHADRNGLNNTRSNLRWCDKSSNACNRHKHGLIGVRLRNGTFRARIKLHGKGYEKVFKTAGEAIGWRDQMALKLHGEFAVFNFPEPARHPMSIDRSADVGQPGLREAI